MYDDKAVGYKGYYKIPSGNNEYKLKKQDTRFYFVGYTAGSSSSTGARPNATTHFFRARTLTFSWRLTNDVFISLYDGVTSNARFRLLFPSGTGTIHLDFNDVNRSFENVNMIMDTLSLAGAAYTLGGAEFVSCFIMGWDEEI